jgi:hypothetical protein
LNQLPGANGLNTLNPAGVLRGGNRAIEIRPGPTKVKNEAVFKVMDL